MLWRGFLWRYLRFGRDVKAGGNRLGDRRPRYHSLSSLEILIPKRFETSANPSYIKKLRNYSRDKNDIFKGTEQNIRLFTHANHHLYFLELVARKKLLSKAPEHRCY